MLISQLPNNLKSDLNNQLLNNLMLDVNNQLLNHLTADMNDQPLHIIHLHVNIRLRRTKPTTRKENPSGMHDTTKKPEQ